MPTKEQNDQRLLKMVAEDMKKLWKNSPQVFNRLADRTTGHMRAMAYDDCMRVEKPKDNRDTT